MTICFVASRFPFPITKGDTLRAYHQIRELSREHAVHLITACETAPTIEAIAEMKKYCKSVEVVHVGKARSLATVACLGLGSRLPLQVLYFVSPQLKAAVAQAVQKQRFDVIHAMTVRVAPAVLSVSSVPVVFDFMDSFAANIATRRELVGPLVRRFYDLELTRVASYERHIAQRAAGGFVIAELDRDAIGNKKLSIIPNGVDTNSINFYHGNRESGTLIFTGNMGYQPNVDAATWFAAECWSRLRKAKPDLKLLIVGDRPAAAVAALAQTEGIEVTGRVESMAPYLHRATVAICPIRCGSGMQNKVLEAMAAGTPVITSLFANRSIKAEHGREVLVADNAVDFADAVLRLLNNETEARTLAEAARQLVESQFTWSRRSHQVVQAYQAAIAAFSHEHRKAV